MFRVATFALAAITTLSSCCAQQSLFDSTGRVDVDSIRRQVMSGLPMPNDPANAHAMLNSLDRIAADPCKIWGLRLMPVPTMFSTCHESLAAGAGLLVVEVGEGSPADRAGIKAGMVVLSIDNRTLHNIDDVPPPCDGCKVEVLTEDGVQTACVKMPSVRKMSPSVSSSASSSATESVSVSNLNGQIRIRATLMTPSGPQQVDLRGNRDEVDRQIDALPPELSDQLRRQVTY